MIIKLSDFDSSGKPAATRVTQTHGRETVLVHMQVFGPASVRIARSASELMSPGPGSADMQGLTITQQDGIKSLWWKGELWAIGTGPGTTVDFQIL